MIKQETILPYTRDNHFPFLLYLLSALAWERNMITIRHQSFSSWLLSWVLKQTFCLGVTHRGGEGGGTWQSSIRRGSAPRSNPLPIYIPFWQKRYPLYIPFIEKRYPFHIPTLVHYIPFLSPSNEVNEPYILLINWEWGHYREISDRGLDVLTER